MRYDILSGRRSANEKIQITKNNPLGWRKRIECNTTIYKKEL
jgi:hypothetical protein